MDCAAIEVLSGPVLVAGSSIDGASVQAASAASRQTMNRDIVARIAEWAWIVNGGR